MFVTLVCGCTTTQLYALEEAVQDHPTFRGQISKAEMKLSNFPDLMLKEPDRVSVLLQAIPNEVRQHVVLHGKVWKMG